MSEFRDKMVDLGRETAKKLPVSLQNWLLVTGGQCLTNPNPQVRSLGGLFMLIAPQGAEYVEQVIGDSGNVNATQASDKSVNFEMLP